MTDEQWRLIEPLLPNRAPQRGGRWVDHRVIIDAVAWRQLSRRPWRELPGRFGPWQTAYHRYTVWGRDGTWRRIRDRLQAGRPGHADDLTWLTELADPADRAEPEADGRSPDGATAPLARPYRTARTSPSTPTRRPLRPAPRTRPPAGAIPPGS